MLLEFFEEQDISYVGLLAQEIKSLGFGTYKKTYMVKLRYTCVSYGP